jgi:hypothetical protein
MREAMLSSETSILTAATRLHTAEDGTFFIVTAVKTLNLT